jgi:hypothetical protein
MSQRDRAALRVVSGTRLSCSRHITAWRRRPWRNAALIGEARTYVVKDNGDTTASGNLHDDRIMAYATAEMLPRHEPAHQEVVSLHDELDALMNEGEWERLASAFGGRMSACMRYTPRAGSSGLPR